jgi:hypothetical protein
MSGPRRMGTSSVQNQVQKQASKERFFFLCRRQIVSSKRHRLCVSMRQTDPKSLVVETKHRLWTSFVFVVLQDVITRTSSAPLVGKAKTTKYSSHSSDGRKERIARSPIVSIRIQHVLHLQTREGAGGGARRVVLLFASFSSSFLGSPHARPVIFFSSFFL